jgi:guanine nucleotide-binding protein G(i) subunit alpha
MGCGMSTEEKEGKARNEEIENQLKRDKMLQRNEIKMLLLGLRYAIPSDSRQFES